MKSSRRWDDILTILGPIEKGAEQGQTEYLTRITSALKAAVTTKPPVKGQPRKGKRKGKQGQVFDAEEAVTQREAQLAGARTRTSPRERERKKKKKRGRERPR